MHIYKGLTWGVSLFAKLNIMHVVIGRRWLKETSSPPVSCWKGDYIQTWLYSNQRRLKWLKWTQYGFGLVSSFLELL
jgi:hypothetical protein